MNKTLRTTIPALAAFTLILILMMTLLGGVAEATLVVNKYTNDFTVSSPYNDQLKLCSCENKADTIIVNNVGNFYANFHVEVISPVSDWVTLPEREFSIAPKHQREIPIYVEAPCDETGTFDYTVKVTSSYGRVEYLTRTIRSDTCQNFVMNVVPESQSTNLCTPVGYHVTIENVGAFADSYQLSFGSYNEYVNATREIYLKPGETNTVEATLTLPCTFYGDYTIPVYVSASKNDLEEHQDVALKVVNQFDHSITIDTEQQLCSRVSQEVPLVIKNEIDVPNSFDVFLHGPDFVDVKDNERTFELEGDETKVLQLSANPREGQEGDYPLTVTVRSEYGSISKSREINLAVRNCYDFAIEMRDVSDNTILGDTKCCGLHEYSLNIHNLGQTEETYNLMVDGPSWFRAEELTVRLVPGENKNVRLVAQIPCADESYDIPVTVVLNRFPQVNETILFTLDAQTQRTCHQVNIDDDEFSINKETSIVPVIVHHNGTEGGVYKIELDSELFTPIEKSLTMYPGERRVIHLKTKEDLAEKEFGRYISEPILTYTTEANPASSTDEDIEYIEHLGTELKDKNALVKAWDWLVTRDYGALGVCGWMTIIIVALILLALLIILLLVLGKLLGLRTGWEPTALVTLRIILLAFAILAFILLMFVRLPDRTQFYEQPPTDANPFIIIEQNSVANVDLNNYFDDPDQDILEYSAAQPKDISVRIEKSLMTLTPDHNFAGINHLVVTARDGKGGVKDSPVLDIYVLAEREISWMAWWRAYCVNLNLFLLLALFLLLFVATLFFKEKKRTQKRKNLFVVVHSDRLEHGKGPSHTHDYDPVHSHAAHTHDHAHKRVHEPKSVVVAAPAQKSKPTKKKAAKKAVVRKVVPMSAGRRAALDRALVSSEEHEMRQVLHTHKKRETLENIETLRAALRKFKADRRGYRPKNRVQFYRYLREQDVLKTLQGLPRLKKEMKAVKKTAAKKTVKKKAPKKTVKKAAQKVVKKKLAPVPKRSAQSKALDRALVSNEEHEMTQILGTLGKRETKRNIGILSKALVDFKASRGYKPKNRKNFYRYLNEKRVANALHNKK